MVDPKAPHLAEKLAAQMVGLLADPTAEPMAVLWADSM